MAGDTLAEDATNADGLIHLEPHEFKGTLFALQLVLLLAAIDQTVITTVMPRIVAELGGFDRYAWATVSYLLTSTICVPLLGRLSDNYGRKSLLLCAVGIFAASSVMCGCAGLWHANGMTELIVARAVQGIGGGGILALSFAVVGDILAPADRGKYQGQFAAVFALASIAGPVAGGWVADWLSWRWLFFINVPLGVAAMLTFARAFPYKRVGRKSKLDIAGMIVFTALFTALLMAVSLPATDARFLWVLLAVFLILLPIFLRIETTQPHPLMAPWLFRINVVAISSISLLVTGVGMFGSTMVVPLFLQSVEGMSGAMSGLLLSPLILVVAGSSIGSGLLLSRTKRYKPLVLAGVGMMSLGTILLALLSASAPLLLVLIYMVLVGAGLGTLLPLYTVIIQNAVPQEDLGAVTGFSQFFRSVGGTVGVAIFGSTMQHLYHGQLASLLQGPLPSAVSAVVDEPLELSKMETRLRPLLTGCSISASEIVHAVREALIFSIERVFLCYAVALLLVFVMSLWLEEKPLRAASGSSVR